MAGISGLAVAVVVVSLVGLGHALTCWHCTNYLPTTSSNTGGGSSATGNGTANSTSPSTAIAERFSFKCGKYMDPNDTSVSNLKQDGCSNCKISTMKIAILKVYLRSCDNSTNPKGGIENTDFFGLTAISTNTSYCNATDLCNSCPGHMCPSSAPKQQISALLAVVAAAIVPFYLM